MVREYLSSLPNSPNYLSNPLAPQETRRGHGEKEKALVQLFPIERIPAKDVRRRRIAKSRCYMSESINILKLFYLSLTFKKFENENILQHKSWIISGTVKI